ncbi:MAG: adenylyltransferase/cytidyltransferase family protein, partial [Victivallales bacterium]|nr:adenylyltransferase/cytidyltransferase family protein [Victivallales bacterium]
YLERRRPRVGIYAGTFNPFHIGHFSILEKAEQMFDKVIVAVGINPQKHTGKDLNLAKTLPFHEVISFDTLMVDLIQKESVLSDVTLVRGLRNGYDLDYEMNQLCFMQEMWPATQSVYIPCDKNLEHISSSALKGLSIFDVRGRDYMYYPHKYDYYTKSIKELFE